MKKIILVILVLMLGKAQAFKEVGENTDSLSEVQSLKDKIDSLEIKIEKFQMEMLENNPVLSGKYLSWGKGLTFTFEYPYASVDVGYTFKIIKSTTRLGISLGYDYRHGIDEEKTNLNGYSQHFGHLKLSLGTPVFFNLMSVSAGVAQLYAFDKKKVDGESTILTCTKLNFDFEFWVMPELNLFLGLNTYLYDLFNQDNGSDLITKNSKFNSDTFKVGIRYYLGSRKCKKRMKQVES